MIQNKIIQQKIVAIIREDQFENALSKTKLLVDSGVNIIEITYTTPNAGKIINIIKKMYPNKIVGAGSVVTLKNARDAIRNNSDFIVSPGFAQVVSLECKRKKILYIPGGITPSEFLQSYQQGWSLIKVFPLTFVDPKYINSILKAMPFLKFLGTGGVSDQNIKTWINSGMSSFGLGNWLTSGTKNEIIKKINNLKEITNDN